MSQDWLEPGSDVILLDEVGSSNRLVRFQDASRRGSRNSAHGKEHPKEHSKDKKKEKKDGKKKMKRIHSVGTVFRKKKNTRESVLDGSSQTPESPTTDRPGDTDDIDDDGDYELEGRISNQLNRSGNREDATCQTESRYMIDSLPSEHKIESIEGHQIRNEMETVMPFERTLNSYGLEKSEIRRLTKKPTLREYRTMATTDTMKRMRLSFGRRGRELLKKEREGLSWFGRIIHDIKQRYRLFKTRRRDQFIPIWRHEIKYIETNFGGFYSSFFIFSRYTWLINLLMSFFIFFFIVLIGILDSSWGSIKYDFVPFVPSWQGEKDSFLFLGGYQPYMLDNIYKMKFGYLLTIFACFISSYFLIIRSLRKRFLKRHEASSNIVLDSISPYTTIIFTSWDFSISSAPGVSSHRTATATALKTLLTKNEVQKKKELERKGWKLFWLIGRRVLGNAIVISLLVLEGGLIYLFIQTNSINEVILPGGALVRTTPFLVTFFSVVSPLIFLLVGKLEQYSSPLLETQVTIGRAYIVRLAGIYVLLFSYIHSDRDTLYSQESNCWETKIGQEFYQLLWLNAIIEVVLAIVSSFGINWIQKIIKKNRSENYYEFQLTDNVLDLIYSQSIVWVGLLFSPIIPICAVILDVFVFYAKYISLRMNSKHPVALFSSAVLGNYFLVILLVTLFVSAVPAAYAMTSMKPACALFANQTAMYEVIPEIVDNMPSFFSILFSFIGTAGFVVPLIFALSVWIYYLLTINLKRKRRVKELDEEVLTEREDKRYLLRFYRVQL